MGRQDGFSLVELMIVVSIIAVLAAIAIPNFLTMQLKAKRAELPLNVGAIQDALRAYDGAHDAFVSCALAPRPDADLDKIAVVFPYDETSGWSAIGYQATGMVRGNYEVVAGETDFVVTGKTDVDDDGTLVVYTASRLTAATLEPGQESIF